MRRHLHMNVIKVLPLPASFAVSVVIFSFSVIGVLKPYRESYISY